MSRTNVNSLATQDKPDTWEEYHPSRFSSTASSSTEGLHIYTCILQLQETLFTLQDEKIAYSFKNLVPMTAHVSPIEPRQLPISSYFDQMYASRRQLLVVRHRLEYLLEIP